MMEDADVLSVLQGAVIAAANAPLATLPGTETRIKAIGRKFTPPQDQKYLEIVWVPNNDAGATWGDEVRYMGLLRLVLHWQNDDRGAYPPMELMQTIAAAFVKDTLLGDPGKRLQIYQPPTMMTPVETPTETLYPLSLRYCSFRQGN